MGTFFLKVEYYGDSLDTTSWFGSAESYTERRLPVSKSKFRGAGYKVVVYLRYFK